MSNFPASYPGTHASLLMSYTVVLAMKFSMAGFILLLLYLNLSLQANNISTVTLTTIQTIDKEEEEEDKTYKDILMAVGIPIAGFVIITYGLFLIITSMNRSKHGVNTDVSYKYQLKNVVNVALVSEVNTLTPTIKQLEEHDYICVGRDDITCEGTQINEAVVSEDNGGSLVPTMLHVEEHDYRLIADDEINREGTRNNEAVISEDIGL